MGNIKLTQQSGDYILMNTLEKKEKLNENIVEAVRSTGFKGIVPFEVRDSRGKRVIVSKLTGMYSILTRLQSPIDSKELVIILKGLIDSLRAITKQRIPPSCIDLDLDYMFIRRDGSVLLTLWALDGLEPKASLKTLLKQIGQEAKPNAKRDSNFINGYLKIFDGDFTMKRLEGFVLSNYEMIRESAITEGSKPLVTPSQQLGNSGVVRGSSDRVENREVGQTPSQEPAQRVETPTEASFDDDMLVPTGKTTFLVDHEDDDPTAKTSLLTDELNIRRYILREKTSEEFQVTNGSFVLGKQGADIEIGGNRAISRVHAKITIFDGVVTLEDLGSSNGTYLNQSKLPSNEPVQILNGDVFSLANEVFVYVEK